MLVPRHFGLRAGQRVSRKYRLASIRRSEYRRLKAIVPSIANKHKVSKVKVVEEAIKYIDELQRALFKRAPFLVAHLGDASTPVVDPFELVARMFPPTTVVPASSPSDCPSGNNSTMSGPLAQLNKRPCTGGSLRPLQSSNYVNIAKSS
jgi:hypothetical protein